MQLFGDCIVDQNLSCAAQIPHPITSLFLAH
jgi:hypothetical protein